MQEPPRDTWTYQRRGWNTGYERQAFMDRQRRQNLRRKWREYLRERKQIYNTTGDARP